MQCQSIEDFADPRVDLLDQIIVARNWIGLSDYGQIVRVRVDRHMWRVGREIEKERLIPSHGIIDKIHMVAQMPFAAHPRPITRLPQKLWKRDLGRIEASLISVRVRIRPNHPLEFLAIASPKQAIMSPTSMLGW